jgi:flagellar hook-length control protein FliK
MIDPNSLQTNLTSMSEHDNPALNWIDSESYQSLAAKTEQTNPALQSKTLAEVNPKIQTDLEAAPMVIDGASVSVDKIKNEAHSLQKLSTSMMYNSLPTDTGAKLDSLTQNLGATVQNTQTQAVLPQPLHAQPQKTLDIPLPLNHAQWGDKFAEHIIWLGNNDIKSAVIKISPEELGPLEISVKVVKDSASVNILSHSMHVRDMVDQAIPRLRDMMADQGLNLANVHVSADTRSNNQFAQNNNSNDPQYEASFNETEEEPQLITSIKKPSKGLVDYFA